MIDELCKMNVYTAPKQGHETGYFAWLGGRKPFIELQVDINRRNPLPPRGVFFLAFFILKRQEAEDAPGGVPLKIPKSFFQWGVLFLPASLSLWCRHELQCVSKHCNMTTYSVYATHVCFLACFRLRSLEEQDLLFLSTLQIEKCQKGDPPCGGISYDPHPSKSIYCTQSLEI